MPREDSRATAEIALINVGLSTLHPQQEKIIEVRCLVDGMRGVHCGYFQDRAKAAEAIAKLSADGSVYTVMNTPNPAVYARAADRIQRNARTSTSDNDIERRNFVLIDVDPVRPSNVSATDEEKARAKAVMQKVIEFLRPHWGTPYAVADSGNGYHGYYLINEPANAESADLVRNCLKAIKASCDDSYAKVDETVFNAARIVTAYGTLKKKGDSTADRPHRMSRVLKVDTGAGIIPTQDLRAVAALAPAPAVSTLPATQTPRSGRSGAPDGAFRNNAFRTAEDLAGWLARYGLAVFQEPAPYQGGMRYKLAHCPFDANHTNGEAAVFWFTNGPRFECRHASCQSKTWRDVRDQFEPREQRRAVTRVRNVPQEPPPEVQEMPPPDEDEEVSPHHAPGGYTVNMYGRKVPNAANCVLELRERGLAAMFSYDLFTQQYMTTFPDIDAQPHELSDLDLDHLHIQLSRIPDYARIGADAVHQAVRVVSRMNQRDPVLEWIDGLEWDGTQRLPKLAAEAFGATDPFSGEVLLNLVVASVARQYRPGAKYDCMPILEGIQGIGKSVSLRALFGAQYVSEWDRHVDSKDFAMQMGGMLVLEFAELSSLRRSESDAIKSVLSKPVDVYRPPYGRTRITSPRRVVFVGTTNEGEYLSDDTGNRRFLPVKCQRVNLQWIKLNRAQLFAEARTRFRDGHRWWQLSIEDASVQQESRRIAHPWEERVHEFIDRTGTTMTTVNDLLIGDPIRMPSERLNREHARLIAGILHRMGWISRNVRRAGRRARWWFASESDAGQPSAEAEF